METMQNILTRRSVRKFADKPIEPDKLHTILEAAMSGPCAVNAREWAFIIVTDREKLAQMAKANGRVARMLNQAAAAILVCGDLDRAFPPAPDFWVIDAAIAAQNMTLAANDLGIGSVWLGTWPDDKRVKRQAQFSSCRRRLYRIRSSRSAIQRRISTCVQCAPAATRKTAYTLTSGKSIDPTTDIAGSRVVFYSLDSAGFAPSPGAFSRFTLSSGTSSSHRSVSRSSFRHSISSGLNTPHSPFRIIAIACSWLYAGL